MKKNKILVSLLSLSILSLALSGCAGGESKQSDAQSSSQSQSGANAVQAPKVDRDPKEALPEITFDKDGKPSMKAVEGEAPTEITTKVLKKGSGAEVDADSIVTVNYAGFLWSNGKEFDSSYSRGQEATFSLNGVIAGWKWGLNTMHVGDTVEIVVPPEFGYGSQEQGSIPADSTLVFVVDIKNVVKVNTDELAKAKPTNNALPEGMTVSGDLASEPTIKFKSGAKAPTKYDEIVLAEGNGPVITDNDATVYYAVGTFWGTDEPSISWKNGESQAPAGSSLTGLKVGSRVAFVVPSDSDAQPANVMVVDILAAYPAK